MTRERCWWGWGYQDAHLDGAALDGLAGELRSRFGGRYEARRAAAPQDVALPAPAIRVPDALSEIVTDDSPAGIQCTALWQYLLSSFTIA